MKKKKREKVTNEEVGNTALALFPSHSRPKQNNTKFVPREETRVSKTKTKTTGGFLMTVY
jgi:hypothetical protein